MVGERRYRLCADLGTELTLVNAIEGWLHRTNHTRSSKMKERKYTYAQLGMLFGIFIGGGLGVVLFATTMNAVYLAIAGAGAAIGLVLGAAVDKHRGAS